MELITFIKIIIVVISLIIGYFTAKKVWKESLKWYDDHLEQELTKHRESVGDKPITLDFFSVAQDLSNRYAWRIVLATALSFLAITGITCGAAHLIIVNYILGA
jgi:uncharacterized protein YneF (UPF0154 family)